MKERLATETRVALTPETVMRLVQKKGHRVYVQSGAGAAAGFDDASYSQAGATVIAKNKTQDLYNKAEIFVAVQKPQDAKELQLLNAGALWVSFFWPLNFPKLAQAAAKQKIDVLAMDAIPRITRAQRMDALSSQTNLAGYKAVLLAANQLLKIFPLLMTAAGTITPAKVVILGAGVAGLQAIATARRLGAQVEVSDVRPAVKEQVESLGARYIEVPPDAADAHSEDQGGYAREMTPEYLQKQKELLAQHIAEADAVITTALVPGKKAPVLINKQMIAGMRIGSVIVDMAAEQGGNCELCQAGKNVEHNGVTIMGVVNLPATLPYHASQLYSRNVGALLEAITKEEGQIELDLNDEIIQGALIVHNGKVRERA